MGRSIQLAGLLVVVACTAMAVLGLGYWGLVTLPRYVTWPGCIAFAGVCLWTIGCLVEEIEAE